MEERKIRFKDLNFICKLGVIGGVSMIVYFGLAIVIGIIMSFFVAV